MEARYGNALEMAKIQHEKGIRGTYYFRFLPGHFDTGIIREIAAMGHEIGYHYDDLSYCKGNYEKAIRRFEKNLATLREIAPVKTICMEGAPLSKWDNRWLWGKGVQSSKFKVQSSLNTAHRSPLTVHRSPLTAHRSPFTVHRSLPRLRHHRRTLFRYRFLGCLLPDRHRPAMGRERQCAG
ncbi:MAG TPA: hypothetical protein PLR01_01945 [Bacteroidales bacterium]|nr:hypothetical protein [Bacteroidales bacterium]